MIRLCWNDPMGQPERSRLISSTIRPRSSQYHLTGSGPTRDEQEDGGEFDETGYSLSFSRRSARILRMFCAIVSWAPGLESPLVGDTSGRAGRLEDG